MAGLSDIEGAVIAVVLYFIILMIREKYESR